MKIWDISVSISRDLPVWPGDPKAKVERVNKIEEGKNANVSRLDMGCHTGTHVDAPFHFISGAATIERLPLDVLVGPTQVIQISDDFSIITGDIVIACGIKPGTTRVIFKTVNSTFWQKYGSQFRTEFVGVDKSGAEALVKLGVKLVGIDYLSIAPFKMSRPTHEVLLEASMVIIEGLDLSAISPGDYNLICLPIKIDGADGAPARAILTQDD
jgi:arylformamidase